MPEAKITDKTHAKVELNKGKVKLKVSKIIKVQNNEENTPMLHVITSLKQTHET